MTNRKLRPEQPRGSNHPSHWFFGFSLSIRGTNHRSAYSGGWGEDQSGRRSQRSRIIVVDVRCPIGSAHGDQGPEQWLTERNVAKLQPKPSTPKMLVSNRIITTKRLVMAYLVKYYDNVCIYLIFSSVNDVNLRNSY